MVAHTDQSLLAWHCSDLQESTNLGRMSTSLNLNAVEALQQAGTVNVGEKNQTEIISTQYDTQFNTATHVWLGLMTAPNLLMLLWTASFIVVFIRGSTAICCNLGEPHTLRKLALSSMWSLMARDGRSRPHFSTMHCSTDTPNKPAAKRKITRAAMLLLRCCWLSGVYACVQQRQRGGNTRLMSARRSLQFGMRDE